MFGASRTAGPLAVIIAGLLTLPATAMAAEADTPPPSLEVTTRSHYEPDIPSKPGETKIDIKATFLWRVTVTVRAHGATVLSEEPPAEEGGEFDSDPGELHTSFVSWSCKQPGTVYSYVVTATAEFSEESSLTKSGSFVRALPYKSIAKKCVSSTRRNAASSMKNWPVTGSTKRTAARLAANRSRSRRAKGRRSYAAARPVASSKPRSRV